MARHLFTALLTAAVLGVVACTGQSADDRDVSENAAAASPSALPVVRLYVFDCGTLVVADAGRFSLMPDEVSTLELSVPCYLIEHPDGRLLWDAGLSDDLAEGSPHTQENGTVTTVTRTLAAQLEELGLTPSDVTYLALSHMHYDHAGNANLFAGSTWLVQRPEHEAAFGDAQGFFDRSLYSDLESAETVLLDGDHDVFGDGSVVIKSAPGHTPGHQVLFVNLSVPGPIVLSGDLYHFPENRLLKRVPTFNYGGIHLTAPSSLQCCNLAPGPARRWEGQGPWLRPRPLRCDGATPLGLGVHHEMPVGERWRADGKVHEAVEQQPACPRVPSVETEAELVEVRLQVVGLHCALVSAEKPSLGERGDPVHTWQWDVRWQPRCADVEWRVPVVLTTGGWIGPQTVADDHRAGCDVRQEERTERLRGRVRDDLHSRAAVARGRALLDSDGHQHLAGCPSSTLARLDPAEEALIGLNVAVQPLTARAHHRTPVAVQHGPGRLIAAQAEHALQSQRRDAVLLRGQWPGGGEPHGERRASVLEDGAGCAGYPPTAVRTTALSAAQLPARRTVTGRASETRRPAQPVQVVPTRGIVGKPCTHRGVVPRVVHSGPRHTAILPTGAVRWIPLFNYDEAQTLESMDLVEDFLSETGATLWIEHDSAAYARLEKSPAYYE